MMLTLKIKSEDIHRCKETDHVHATVRTGLGQPTVHTGDPGSGGHHLGDPGLDLVC